MDTLLDPPSAPQQPTTTWHVSNARTTLPQYDRYYRNLLVEKLHLSGPAKIWEIVNDLTRRDNPESKAG